MTAIGRLLRTAADRVQRGGAVAHPRQRPGGDRRRGRGQIFARYTADARGDRDADGLDRYSFAAGGPIVSPRHAGLLVTPVAPHAAFDRAVFLHPDEGLRVHVLERSAPLLLEADGQRVAELRQGDCIEFRSRARSAKVLRLHHDGFYERARRKLQLTDSSELAPR